MLSKEEFRSKYIDRYYLQERESVSTHDEAAAILYEEELLKWEQERAALHLALSKIAAAIRILKETVP